MSIQSGVETNYSTPDEKRIVECDSLAIEYLEDAGHDKPNYRLRLDWLGHGKERVIHVGTLNLNGQHTFGVADAVELNTGDISIALRPDMHEHTLAVITSQNIADLQTSLFNL